MSEFIHKSHNVTVLMHHLVFPFNQVAGIRTVWRRSSRKFALPAQATTPISGPSRLVSERDHYNFRLPLDYDHGVRKSP